MARRSASGLLTALLMVLLPALSHAQLSYSTSFQQNTAQTAGNLVIADFNRDGKADFAMLQGSLVSVYFNQGAGVFGNRHDTAVPSDSYLIQAADLNKDGHLDLIIAESSPNVVVLLGRGDGTFAAPIDIPLSTNPIALVLGDFNNDGNVDFAVNECASWNTPCDIAVYLGNGTGTFTLTTVLNTPAGGNRSQLVAADFNKDGKLDLATVATAPSRGLVFFGNGNGSFNPPITLNVSNPLPPQSAEASPNLVSGDFNGDGIPDLAIMAGYICGGSACGGANITTFLGNGAGGFAVKSRWNDNNAFGPDSMRVVDLNNDLKQDIVTFNGSPWVGGLENWLGHGDATFALGSTNWNLSTPSDFEYRDLNLDGRYDVVGSDWMATGVWAALNQNGTPNCAPPGSDTIRAKFCSPGATASKTFTVKAAGNSPVGIQRMELWVDGVKRYQVLNDQLRFTLTLTTGLHRLTAVAVDQYVGYAKTSMNVSVR